jgi:hypothetical protein
VSFGLFVTQVGCTSEASETDFFKNLEVVKQKRRDATKKTEAKRGLRYERVRETAYRCRSLVRNERRFVGRFGKA